MEWQYPISRSSSSIGQIMVGIPLDKMCTAVINICDYILAGRSILVSIAFTLILKNMTSLLSLENPLPKTHIRWNSGLPSRRLPTTPDHPSCPMAVEAIFVLSNLRNFATVGVYKPKRSPKKDGAPREDDCINMDKGGRCHAGRLLSKRTRTMQALASHHICRFGFTVQWDLFFGYYIATSRAGVRLSQSC